MLSNIRELCSFLGLYSAFRRPLQNFARITDILNWKFGKVQPRINEDLSDEELDAPKMLEQKLISPLVLALLHLQGSYTVDTGSCDRQMRCVLLQKQSHRHNKPNDYGLRSLTEAERTYDSTHLECLAVVWVVLLLSTYLEDTRFTTRTNHDAFSG